MSIKLDAEKLAKWDDVEFGRMFDYFAVHAEPCSVCGKLPRFNFYVPRFRILPVYCVLISSCGHCAVCFSPQPSKALDRALESWNKITEETWRG